ncbi:MAG TPA: hypothetical protein VG125_05830, partial [Pirellulales bacterium]|nr:hypothetical protein [Pirellulales bacterium]
MACETFDRETECFDPRREPEIYEMAWLGIVATTRTIDDNARVRDCKEIPVRRQSAVVFAQIDQSVAELQACGGVCPEIMASMQTDSPFATEQLEAGIDPALPAIERVRSEVRGPGASSTGNTSCV